MTGTWFGLVIISTLLAVAQCATLEGFDDFLGQEESLDFELQERETEDESITDDNKWQQDLPRPQDDERREGEDMMELDNLIGMLKKSMQSEDLDLETRAVSLQVYGSDLDKLAGTHPAKKLRAGFPQKGHSCGSVYAVPSWYRDKKLFFPEGIQSFYTQFTHAYGIPIIASSKVSSGTLKRACYTLRRLLGPRYDVRIAFYKNYGRVAVMHDTEKTMNLPDYKSLGTSPSSVTYWNTKRGLGATTAVPTNSVGAENQRCDRKDTGYYRQDVLVHELTHGVHILGANFGIHGYSRRTGNAYRAALAKGLWKNTYSAKTVFEYMAVGSQLFFSVIGGFVVPVPGGGSKTLKNQNDLRNYDAGLYDLLAEMYPGGVSDFIDRCQYKQCALSQYKLMSSSGKRSSCDKLLKSEMSEKDCAAYTCDLEGNAFQWRSPHYCYPLKCSNPNDLKLGVSSLPYKVYKLVSPPVLNAVKEKNAAVPVFKTTRYPINHGTRCSKKTSKLLGNKLTQYECERSGGCWASNKCYFPEQNCFDNNVGCPDAAQNDECRTNPRLMYKNCPFSCGACSKLHNVREDVLKSMCQNTNINCHMYKKAGYCTNSKYTSFMKSNCCVSCNKCTGCKKPVDPLASIF